MSAPHARRGFLKSACKHCLGFGALLSGLPSPAQNAAPSSSFQVPGRFSRPAVDTDEGGLWSLMDREEARLRRSPLAIRDPALGQYLPQLTCRLTDGHCPDIRVHVMRRADDVTLKGVGWVAVHKDELFAATFAAPRLTFFARLLPMAEAVVKTARIRG